MLNTENATALALSALALSTRALLNVSAVTPACALDLLALNSDQDILQLSTKVATAGLRARAVGLRLLFRLCLCPLAFVCLCALDLVPPRYKWGL